MAERSFPFREEFECVRFGGIPEDLTEPLLAALGVAESKCPDCEPRAPPVRPCVSESHHRSSE